MIGWQNPAALWALAVLAVPIVIHLLRRHRADRVLFPSLRFVPSAQTSAARFRRLSDPLLLVLRMAVLALAVAALARPVILTASRTARWNAATARALVVDTSPSMRAEHRIDRANQAADRDAETATYARRFDVPILADGLARAAAWLRSTPPSRKEIVVISDVQRGAVDPASISRVPGTIGIRFVRIGDAASERRLDGVALLAPDAGESRVHLMDLTPDTTALTIEGRTDGRRAGIRILPESARDSLLRIVARAGAIAGSPEQPIVIRFRGADAAPDVAPAAPLRDPWMLRRVLRLQEQLASTRGIVAGARALDDRASNPWTAVLAADDGRPVVVAAASDGELVLEVGAPADSLTAATILRAALNARVASDEYDEQEIAATDRAALDAWARPAAPVESGAWRNADVTDARWCWLLALALLIVEQGLRRRSVRRGRPEVARVAA